MTKDLQLVGIFPFSMTFARIMWWWWTNGAWGNRSQNCLQWSHGGRAFWKHACRFATVEITASTMCPSNRMTSSLNHYVYLRYLTFHIIYIGTIMFDLNINNNRRYGIWHGTHWCLFMGLKCMTDNGGHFYKA